MARNHARIFTRIWHDEEFRALTVDAQHAYFTILSNPDLSYVGVLDYLPQRIASLAKGNTARRVATALRSLADARFVLTDIEAEELCVRSMVRHDGVLDRVNMGKATARAFGKVLSLDLREVIVDELARKYAEAPNLPGWDGFAEIDGDAMKRVELIASRMASGM